MDTGWPVSFNIQIWNSLFYTAPYTHIRWPVLCHNIHLL